MNAKMKQSGVFVDSHCHLDRVDLAMFDNNFDKLLQQIQQQGVSHLLSVGVSLTSFEAMLKLTEAYAFIYCSVGVHPDSEADDSLSSAQLLESLQNWASHASVIAIGETGLDYFHQAVKREIQLKRFETHIEAALSCNKPLIVHTRQAREDTLAVLRANQAEQVGGVAHCFTEDWQMAKKLLDLGFYISFSGILTFKNAQDLRDVAKKVPLDRTLIETDSPYLTPEPFRGQSNYPGHVPLVAAKLASLKQLDQYQIAEITRNNFFQLFNIPAIN